MNLLCALLLLLACTASLALDCGLDGIYDPVEEACRCVQGFQGALCDSCQTKPTDSSTHICCPVQAGQWVLLAVSDGTSLISYLGGEKSTLGLCQSPDTDTIDGIHLDCSCIRNDTKQLLVAHQETSGGNAASDAAYRLTVMSGNPTPSQVVDLMNQQNTRFRLDNFFCDAANNGTALAGGIIFIIVVGAALLALLIVIIWIIRAFGFRVQRKPKTPKQPPPLPDPESLPPPPPLMTSRHGTTGGLFGAASDPDRKSLLAHRRG